MPRVVKWAQREEYMNTKTTVKMQAVEGYESIESLDPDSLDIVMTERMLELCTMLLASGGRLLSDDKRQSLQATLTKLTSRHEYLQGQP